MESVTDILSNISGIPKEVIKEIAIKVIKNNKLLNSCKRHHFDIEIEKRKWQRTEWQCTECKGIVDSTKKIWYEKGLKGGKL